MNRTVFFDRVRAKPFGGSLTQSQVEGMETILAAADQYGLKVRGQLAYVFATAFLETARTMLPIKEYGGAAYYTKLYDVKGQNPTRAKAHGNTEPGDGPKYCGRGYVQLTWKVNYQKASAIVGADLVANPDLAMRPDIAALIMFDGMTKGWFTGKNLDGYISGTTRDFTNARRIINGTDKAATVAAYAEQFDAALIAAGWAPGAADEPLIIGPKPAEPTSIWAALLAGLAALFKR